MAYSPRIFVLGAAAAAASPAEIGFKAASLARMARLGLPVPEGFVIGTPLCREFLADAKRATAELRGELSGALADLERASRLRFGDPRRPLLVSVRSGAPVSMPGMMDTLANVGLTRTTLRGVLRMTGNPRLAWDSYRRLIESFAQTVHGADRRPFAEHLARTLQAEGAAHAGELDFSALAGLAETWTGLFEELTGERFPEDPRTQLEMAIAAVFRSWNSERARAWRRLHRVAEASGTAATVQRMVFGNAGGTSGSGVAFTRDPATGENRLYVDFMFNAQGEDVVSGRQHARDAGRLAQVLPKAYRELAAAGGALEREFGDAQDIEFTIQEGTLYFLQTRAAARSAWASLRIAVELVREGVSTPAAALERLSGLDLAGICRTRLADDGAAQLATAVPASLGVASGRLALDAATAARFAKRGEAAILACAELSTEDAAGIAAAAGVVSARGSRTAHAAVVARQLGKVCLVGCDAMEIDLAQRSAAFGGRSLREGDRITLDANGGRVLAGEARIVTERPDRWLAELAAWRALPSGAAAAACPQAQP